MSILKKPYEVSVWLDVWDNSTNSFTEEQVAIIGSDTMTSQYRALEPKLKRNVNGSNELTFKMHRHYKDSTTGKDVTNPFIDLIANETKLKLKYKGKWYDFLVKNIQQDSNNTTYSFTATDLHIIELSKNGYGLVMDTTLMNNMGTVNELAGEVLKDTDWYLSGVTLEQKVEEQLVNMVTPQGQAVYVPYSSLKNKPERFQYFTKLNLVKDGVYDGDQTFITVTENNKYTTDEAALRFGFYYPAGWKFVSISEKRGNRLVYTHKSKYNPALNKIVYYYNGGTVAGYTETEYITPNLIENLVTNNTFKSTTGWTGSYAGGEANKGAELNAEVNSSTTPTDLLTDMKEGNYKSDTVYSPCLRIKLKSGVSVVVNSGFYDNRTKLSNIAAGQKFVLFYKEEQGTPFTVTIGERSYLPSSGQYNFAFDRTLMKFSTSQATTYHSTDSTTAEYDGYKYIIAAVDSDYKLTEKEFLKMKAQIFLSGSAGAEYTFSDFQLFPFVADAKDNNVPLLPINVPTEASAVTTYYYYDVDKNPEDPSAEGYKASSKEYNYLIIADSPVKDYVADYTTDKVRSINVKQSNYFNTIQSLCETFECWAEFIIGHDSSGKITTKTVALHEYIGQDNHAGFRYGVNLKQTKRTLDSKAVVTKLIVPDNSNEHAPNGFCSIARAGSNQSGENYIYNFQYYVNMGLLNRETLDDILYNETGNYGEISGYYPKLLAYNTELTSSIDEYTSISNSLMKATADLQVAENGRDAAEEKYQDAADSFSRITGYNFQDINNIQGDTPEAIDAERDRRKDQIDNDKTLQGYLAEVAEYRAAWQKYKKEADQAKKEYEGYKLQSEGIYKKIKKLNDDKSKLNLAFFKKFYRFIQEGTWKGDDYTDHEKYYIDAKSTSNNSCLPKVSYTFSVMDLSPVEGYEALAFDLADKTWVEDTEFFGYGEDGNPYREEVVITEVVYALDEPDKNTIKVQNYKDQFADLFQKQTATVQQVQFAKGAWDKATSFTEEQPAGQAAFLQNALANAELILQNAGEQSVVWDKNGITVTDIDTPSQQLRLVGGAIMMRDEDEDGLGWKTAITSKGINAKVINAGQLNTGLIQIMNGDEPYFRWDAYGITAYYFETNPLNRNYNFGLDTRRGVRFDRLGIYGYRNPVNQETGKAIDGATWHPANIDELKRHSQFALTWDGLFLNLGHATYDEYYGYDASKDLIKPNQKFETPKWHAGTASIGKTSRYLFNKWITNRNSEYHGLPYYDPLDTEAPVFSKIVGIGGADGNEELVIYDDGTLVARRIKLTGSIEWTKNSSPSKTVYGKIELTEPPVDNTPYSKIPEKDGVGTEADPYVWHQIPEFKDSVYAHTDNGGATWEGPFLITGRSIDHTEVNYCMTDRGTEPTTIADENWRNFFPEELIDGKCVYTRMRDVYNNEAKSEWRYSVGYIGTSNYRISLDNDYASIAVLNQEEDDKSQVHLLADQNWRAVVNATVYYGDTVDTGKWIFKVIDSSDTEGLTGSVSGNTITIFPETPGRLAGEEHVVGIQAYNAEKDATLYTSFSAAKLHAGEDAIGYKVTGYPAAIVRHINADNQFTPDDFVLNAYKQIGTKEFKTCDGYWKYTLNDNEAEEFLDTNAKSSHTVNLSSLLGTINKEDLKKITIYFYINANDTIPADKEVITIVEDGRDGTSITGIDELYYAAEKEVELKDLPAIDITNADGSVNTNAVWKYKISDTEYSAEKPNLWNTERMLFSEDGKTGDFTEPAIIAHYGTDGDAGRGLKNVIAYYFLNQDSLTPPSSQPEINKDSPSVIDVPAGWMNSADDFPMKAGDCLWEKDFFEFDKPDADGNIYTAKTPSIVRYIPQTVYRIALTNDSGAVVTDEDGKGGVFAGNMKTSVMIYDGDEEVTNKEENGSKVWTISATASDLTFTGPDEDGYYQVTALNEDVGYITFKATKEGSPTLTTTFKATKVKQGAEGAASTAYWLTCSSATIPIRDDGTYGVQNITFTAMKQKGSEAATTYEPHKFVIYTNGVKTTEITGQSSVTCVLGTAAGNYDVKQNLTCELYFNNDVVLDIQTAEVVRDGSSLSRMEVLNYYLATSTDSGVTVNTTGWTLKLSDAQITADKPYLWNYETITSTNSAGVTISTTTSEPSIIGVYGQTGPAGVGISAIADYYGVSNAKNAEPIVWFNEDESSATGDAMPDPTPETPYLWTYEKFTYTDGTVINTKPRIISELSISIETLEDYYLATTKEAEKPTVTLDENGNIQGDWTTLEKCGHSEDKPYLWTVEIIKYNYGKEVQISEVTLATRSPRSVKQFIEYYYIGNTAAQPAGLTLGADNNSYTAPDGWVKSEDGVPTLEQGQWLWNQEVVEYTTGDEKGENKYSLTSVQLMGYIGTSPYTINLSSDFATIPYSAIAYSEDYKVSETVFNYIDFDFQVFNGSKLLTLGADYVIVAKDAERNDEEDKLQVVIELTNAAASWDIDSTSIDAVYDDKIYTNDWERGTIIVQLYEDNIRVASATYELVKQLGGADGSYEYLVADESVILKLTDANNEVSYEPNSIGFSLLKRIGDNEPIPSTATRYAKVSVGEEELKSFEFSEGSFNVNDYIINGEISGQVKVEVFSDAECTKIIDREVIPIINHGVDAYNTTTVTLYQRGTIAPATPGAASYDFTKATPAEALLWTNGDGGWKFEPQPDNGDGTNRYKTMVSIRDRLTTHPIEADDWCDPILDEQPPTLTKTIEVYQSVAIPEGKTADDAKPTVKPGKIVYNLKENRIKEGTETLLGDWSTTVPQAQEGYARFFCYATCSNKAWEHTVDEWGEIGLYAEEGMQTESLVLYQRPVVENVTAAAQTPVVPISGKLIYDFVNRKITDTSATAENLNGWSITEVADNGYPLWTTRAKVISKSSTCPITWADPQIEVPPAQKTAEVHLYKLVGSDESMAMPTGSFNYTFGVDSPLTAVGAATLNGWSLTVPSRETDEEKRKTCYVIAAIAASIYPYDIIDAGEWSTPVIYVQNVVKEYLVITPPNIQGTYSEGKLIYKPNVIDIASYIEINNAPAEETTANRYITYQFNEIYGSEEQPLTSGFALDGQTGSITFKLYKDSTKKEELDTKTANIVTDAIHISEIRKWYLTTSKDKDVTRGDIGWKMTNPDATTSVLPYVWTYEEVIYTDGNITYTTPIRLTSEAPYTLTLDNDSDVVAISNQTGQPVLSGNLTTVKVQRWIGNANKDTADGGVITCFPPEGFTENVHYTFTATNNVYSLTVTSLPTGFTKGSFTFIWAEKKVNGISDTGYANKMFSLSTHASLVDYEFKLDSTVFNSSDSGGTYNLKVIKRSTEGSPEIYKDNSDGIKIYNGEKEISTWINIPYAIDQKGPITYVLKDSNGMVWDTETIEFVNDGAYEYIVPNASEVIAVYNSSHQLEYVPNTIEAEVYRKIGSREENVTESRYFKITCYDKDGNELKASGTNITLSGDVDSIVIESFKDAALIGSTAKITIPVVGKTNSVSGPVTYYETFASGTEIKITDSSSWSTDKNEKKVTAAKPYLWGYDEYTYSDGTKIQNTPRIVEQGPEYRLSLDNDSDVVAKTTTGEFLIGGNYGNIEVQATCYVGGQVKTGVGTVTVTGSYPGITTSFENNKLSVTAIEKGTALSGCNYAFVWTVDGVEVDKKVFSLTSVSSEEDYDLIVPRTTINNSDGEAHTDTITVLQKREGTTKTLDYNKATALDLGIYKTEGKDTSLLTSWTVEYSADQTGKIKYQLKTKNSGQIWDEETVEFVNDGIVEKIILTSTVTQINGKYNDSGNLEYNKGSEAITAKVTQKRGQNAEKDVVRTIKVMIDGEDKGELTNITTILPTYTGTTIKQVELWAYKGSVVTATLPITVNIEANYLKDTEDWYYPTSNAELRPTGNEEIGWSQTAVSVSESVPYVWHLVKSIFANGTKLKTTPTRTEWAAPILCYIDSSMGNLFEQNQTGDTTLTAKIYKGSVEVDSDGSKCTYKWYKGDGNLLTSATTKSITVTIASVRDQDVYFVAEDK